MDRTDNNNEMTEAQDALDPNVPAQEAGKKRSGFIGVLILFIKGIVVGVANIIPGVSGGTIAVVTGIFDPLIEAINTLFKKFLKNLKFLVPVGLGLVVGIVAFSKIIKAALVNFPLQTGLFFAGLVLGSVPLILKKAYDSSRKGRIEAGAAETGIDAEKAETTAGKGFRMIYLVPFALCAVAVVTLAVVQTFFMGDTGSVAAAELPELNIGNIMKLFFGGVISAGAMVVPGVSGSLVMMLIGIYDDVLAIISGLVSFGNMHTVLSAALCALPLALGIVVGIFTIAKIISFLFKKFTTGTYYGILGLLCGSVLALLINLWQYNIKFSVLGIIIAILCAAAGTAVSYFSSRLDLNEQKS